MRRGGRSTAATLASAMMLVGAIGLSPGGSPARAEPPDRIGERISSALERRDASRSATSMSAAPKRASAATPARRMPRPLPSSFAAPREASETARRAAEIFRDGDAPFYAFDLRAAFDVYAERGFEPMWTLADGSPSIRAERLLARLADADAEGLYAEDYVPVASPRRGDVASRRALADLALSASALLYARHALNGRFPDPQAEDDEALRPADILRALVRSARPDRRLAALHPAHPTWRRLRRELKRTDHDENLAVRIALDRLRALPRKEQERHILVNVPAFELMLFEGNNPALRSRAVVGSPWAKTRSFSTEVSRATLRPYWHVPDGYARRTLIPEIRDNGFAQLRRKGFVALDPQGKPLSDRRVAALLRRGKEPIKFRQNPGPHNPLGAIRLHLPNRFMIMIHDTPERHLFERPIRTFSRGCVRVEHAERLAARALDLEVAEIERMLESPRTRQLALRRPLPTHIVYLTAWIDEEDRLVLLDDVYRRDVDSPHLGKRPRLPRLAASD